MRTFVFVVLAALACAAAATPLRLEPLLVVVDDGQGASAQTGTVLPYSWDANHRFGGSASFEFALGTPLNDGPQGIFLPRVGNSFRVWLDGRLLVDTVPPDPRTVTTIQSPRLVVLPEEARQGGRLRIDIVALPGADAGLSAVLQGPLDELSPLHASVSRWRTAGAVAVSAISLILGALALLVWFNQRDRLYLWYCVAEICWSLRTAGQYLGDAMWLPWPWWGAVMLTLYCSAFASICCFGLTLVGQQKRWGVLVAAFAAGSAILIAITHVFVLHDAWRHWRFVTIAVCGACAAVVVRSAWRSRAIEPTVLSAVFGLGLLAGLRDWWVITVHRSYDSALPWITYTWLLFGAAMAWLLANRLREATAAQSRYAQDLGQRLATQELELGRAFAAQRHSSALQAAQEERRRVLQDMHDGVGHELLGALQVAQETTSPREQVTTQIQRAMDHLKLSVDALQEGAQDVATVLGLLRYRLAPRLQRAGITVEWRVSHVPPLKDWDTRKARDLQLLMYEAFTNLLVHSGASRTYFEAAFDADAGQLRITLADNGRGLPDDFLENAGNGLASIKARAQRLAGTLRFHNGCFAGYPGACIELNMAFQAQEAQRTQELGAPPSLSGASAGE